MVPVVAAILFLLFKYRLGTDGDRIRGDVAVKKMSLLRLGNLIAQDYSDSYGFDKQRILGAAQQVFESFDRIVIEIANLSFVQTPTKLEQNSYAEWKASARVRFRVTFDTDQQSIQLLKITLSSNNPFYSM